jgi:hypothetical protein
VLRGGSRNGVTILNSPGSGVAYCDISEMGEIGESFTGGGNRITLTSGTNFAQCNTIHRVSRLSWTYNPAIYLIGVGYYIGHNLIYDAPHNAVLLYGNNHLVEYNEIHHVCTATADAGAIYMGQDWTMRGNVFRYNYIHDINLGGGATDPSGVIGLYLDDYFSGSTVFGNIFCAVDHGLLIGGGRDNTVQNNIFAGCTNYAIHVDQRGLGWESSSITNTNSSLWTKLKAMPYQTPPWSIQYPALVGIATNNPGAALGNVIQQNICYNAPWLQLLDNVGSVLSITNNFTTGDPQFVNYAQRQFGLSTNSLVWTLGFQPIPMNSFGPGLLPAAALRIMGPQ